MMQTPPRKGKTFTIARVYEPDRRWWKKLLARLLRRPPPVTGRLQRFNFMEEQLDDGSFVPIKDL